MTPIDPLQSAADSVGRELVMMTDDQIKHMVNRFLSWSLPENFKPDAGISFTRQWYMNFAGTNRIPSHPLPMPSGTNLFDATQADAMVRYMVEGLSSPSPSPAQPGAEREEVRPALNELLGRFLVGRVTQEAVADAILKLLPAPLDRDGIARLAELEANERAYEAIIGQMSYQQVADRFVYIRGVIANNVERCEDILFDLNGDSFYKNSGAVSGVIAVCRQMQASLSALMPTDDALPVPPLDREKIAPAISKAFRDYGLIIDWRLRDFVADAIIALLAGEGK